MDLTINNLFSLTGRFSGKGINHEGQPFTGVFEIKSPIIAKGLSFSFEAIGEGNKQFHNESSLIGMTMKGTPTLWVLSSNHPGVFERTLKSHEVTTDGTSEIIFAFGNKDDKESFREEIKIAIHPDRSISYTYFWGMPNGEFAERSGCRMFPETK